VAATVRSSSAYASAATETATSGLALPPGWQPSDVVYIGWELTAATGVVTTPPGWALAVPAFVSAVGTSPTSGHAGVFRRVMQSGDTAPVISFTSGRFAAALEAIQGADNTTPEDVTPVTDDNTGVAVPSVRAPSIVPVTPGCLLLTFHAVRNGTSGATTAFTPDASLTEQADIATTVAAVSEAAIEAATLALADTSATGTKTATATGSNVTVLNTMGVAIAVRPAMAAAAGAAQPGRTWLRRYRHPQLTPPFPLAAAPAPQAPAPLMRPVIGRRAPARARIGALGLAAAGIASGVVTPLGTPGPHHPAIAHPPPARARAGPAGRAWGGVASRVVTPLGGAPSPQPRPVIVHPAPRRAVLGSGGRAWGGIASAAVTPLGTPSRPAPFIYRSPRPNTGARAGPRGQAAAGQAGPGNQVPAPAAIPPRLPPQPRRAVPARGIWRRVLGPGNQAAQARQRPAPRIMSRPASRAVTRGLAAPAGPPPVVTPPPRFRPQPRRAIPGRGRYGGQRGTGNALAPAFTIGALTAGDAAAGLLTAGTVPGAALASLGLVSENTAVTHAQSWAADVAVLGRVSAWQSFYYHTSAAFPVADTTASVPAAGTLMITWFGWADSEVNAGQHDAEITARAVALKALGRPVILRWDIEMNITAWGYEATGAAANGPSFVTAWRRVRGLFTAAGASNVAFAWTPNASSAFDPQSWRPYYPGDAYVDWVGVDGYNFGNSNVGGPTTWQTAYQVFHAFTDDWKAGFGGLSGGKPLLIGETGCFEGGGSKSWWYTDLSGFLRSTGFSGVTLFNTNQSPSGINWRWDTDAGATAAAAEIANDPWFGGNTSGPGGGYAAAVAATAPFAWWQLGELSGSLADSSGSGLTAATAGSTGTTTRGCVLKWPGAGYGLSCYSFGRADLGTLGSLGSSLTAGFTISFLFKDGNSGAQAAILGTLNTGTTTGLMIQANTDHTLAANAGRTTFWFRNEGGVQHWAEITGALYDGLWHHVTWVASPGGTDVVYVDGAAQALTSASNPAPGTTANFGFSLYLGARDNRGATDQPAIAVFSHLALWKARLSAAQVAGLYAALTASAASPGAPRGSVLTSAAAAQGALTARDQRTGGPS
jgi:Glycosyl hydrolase family 26